MSTKLSSLTQRAKENPKHRFTRLIDLLTEDFLKECFWELKRDKASGVIDRTLPLLRDKWKHTGIEEILYSDFKTCL
jgi:hypothetical protein